MATLSPVGECPMNTAYRAEAFYYIPSGAHQLAAFVSQPDNLKSAPVIILCHGYMGTKSEKCRHFFRLAQKLTACGFLTVRFDFAGCGDSLAHTTDFSLRQGVDDICAVYRFLEHNGIGNTAVLGLAGYSLGGLITVRAIDRLPALEALCLIASVEHAILSAAEKFALKFTGTKTVWNKGTELSMDFVRDFASAKGAAVLAQSSLPVQLIYASADETVPAAHFDAYKKTLNAISPQPVLIKGADHFFSEKPHQELLDQTAIEFFKKNLFR